VDLAVLELVAAPPPATVPEEVALVRAAAAGDGEAFVLLVRRCWPGLVRLARIVLAGDDEAEDLAQEALTHAWRRLAQLRDPERFLPWLRRSLVRRGARLARRRRRRATREERDPETLLALPAPLPPLAVDVPALLAALSPRQRAVFFLTDVDGLSSAEAARFLGIAEATLRVHRMLARRRLRSILEGALP
jgi:RNA polymerase sigma-70 factor (ECF subfamily)